MYAGRLGSAFGELASNACEVAQCRPSADGQRPTKAAGALAQFTQRLIAHQSDVLGDALGIRADFRNNPSLPSGVAMRSKNWAIGD